MCFVIMSSIEDHVDAECPGVYVDSPEKVELKHKTQRVVEMGQSRCIEICIVLSQVLQF